MMQDWQLSCLMSEGQRLLMVWPRPPGRPDVAQVVCEGGGGGGMAGGAGGTGVWAASVALLSRLIRSDRSRARHHGHCQHQISPNLAKYICHKMLHHRVAADANCPLCIE